MSNRVSVIHPSVLDIRSCSCEGDGSTWDDPSLATRFQFFNQERRFYYIPSSSINTAVLLSPFMHLIPSKLRCFQPFHTTGKQGKMLLHARIWHKMLGSGKDLYKCTHMLAHTHTYTHVYNMQYQFLSCFLDYKSTETHRKAWGFGHFLCIYYTNTFGLRSAFLEALLYMVPYLFRSFWKAEVRKAATVRASNCHW